MVDSAHTLLRQTRRVKSAEWFDSAESESLLGVVLASAITVRVTGRVSLPVTLWWGTGRHNAALYGVVQVSNPNLIWGNETDRRQSFLQHWRRPPTFR